MKEVDEKVLKNIYLNILKAILVIFYFLIVNLVYEKINDEIFKRAVQVCTMIFLLIAIYLFEKAYKKDDNKTIIEGIEILILSGFTLTIEYITNRFHFNFKSYSLSASYIFAIYFILKSIIIYTKGRNEIAKSLSDIEEIVKKEEPIKKEAKKRKKEVKEND